MTKLLCITFILLSSMLFSQSKIESGFANNPDYEPYTNWIDSSYAECLQNWTTNIEWGACIGKHKEMWLDFMNYEYKELLTSLDDEGKTLLKASQEAWIRNNLVQEQFWDYFLEQKPNFFGREGTFGSNMVDLQIIRKRAVEIHIYKNAFH